MGLRFTERNLMFISFPQRDKLHEAMPSLRFYPSSMQTKSYCFIKDLNKELESCDINIPPLEPSLKKEWLEMFELWHIGFKNN